MNPVAASADSCTITLFGRSGEVTGSCYLLQCPDGRLLLECGLFQGGDELEALNAAPFPFRAADIDAVVLSHAHLDHTGLVPRLVREGFRGPIHCTAPTRDLAALLWRDAVNVQQIRELPELYDADDVLRAFERVRVQPYDHAFQALPGCRVMLRDAGHILGSASIQVDFADGGRQGTLVFSGDLGNASAAFMHEPAPASGADTLVLESTYGDREHPPLEEALDALADILRRAHAAGGNVVIPCFAVARTQEMLFHLGSFHRQGRLAQEQVYLDSPLAIEATRVYEQYQAWWAPRERDAFRRAGAVAFCDWLPPLRFTYAAAASRAINDIGGGAVILAGSGMCSGGRVLHHLRHHLGDPRHQVVLVGFQAPGTLGRALQDGARKVQLFDESHRVAAAIHSLPAFSAHAGQADLLRWAEASGAATVYLVHGEAGAMQVLQTHLAGRVPGAVRVAERGRPLPLALGGPP